ncbi:MAG: hypothetical protein JW869_00760 [Candidatus Omnitrophica bacterium]|nr:hypothetical protein [Candidatus Omnitrophota bacterium]
MNFKVNLIKTQVIPLEKRKALSLAIIIYLAICVSILSFLLYQMASDIIEIAKSKNDVGHLESSFFQENFQRKNGLDYTLAMKEEVLKCIDKLELVDGVLSKRVDMINLLLRLSRPLPAGSYIDNFNFDNITRNSEFDVVIPESYQQGNFNISNLISAWKQDSFLKNYIENIHSSSSRRQQKGEEIVYISRFSCALNKSQRY